MLSEHIPRNLPGTVERVCCYELTEALRTGWVRYKLSLGPQVGREIPAYVRCSSTITLGRDRRPPNLPKRPPTEQKLQMSTAISHPGKAADLDSPLLTFILCCLVAAVCYLADGLASVLGIPPDHIASFWCATPLLVAVMLLAPSRIWPALMAAGLGGIALHDFESGVPIGFAIWDSLGNAAEVLIATFGIRRAFKGAPKLNSVKTLAKYFAVAVILAPFVSALLGANYSSPGKYWLEWRIWFFADSLAFLTVTPAIITWVQDGRAWARKSHSYLELAALLTALVFCGFLTFMGTGRTEQPALLYSLVPILLWAALRLGLKGVSTSMVVVALLSTWGSAYDRGPFTGLGPVNNVLALQLFLFFAAMPFMVLAVLVEDHKRGQQALIDGEAQLTEAQRLAELGSWQWDPKTDVVTWSERLYRMAGYNPALPPPSFKNHDQFFTPESWDRLNQSVDKALRTGTPYELDLEAVRPDGTRLWVTSRGEAVCDDGGRPIKLRGTIQDITGRKRIEQALRESEERFRLVANKAPVFIWMSGTDKACTFFNQSWLDFTGRTMEQELGEGWAASVHPEDLAGCLQTYSSAFDARVDFEMEYRLKRFDGKYRWIVDYGVPRIASDGVFCGYIGSCVDITDRRLAAESLTELSGRLINAQDEERTRIAREVHDDFSQRVALQGIGLGQLWRELSPSEVKARTKIKDLLKTNQELSSDLHSLSHQLHSSKLEIVGLAPALMGLCEEMSSKYKIPIEFTERGVSPKIPKDVALCVFRVAQEALSNVVKHSEATQAQAEFRATNNEIRLRIVDAGVGFDPSLRRAAAGIGLVGMRERMRLVGGVLSIRSAPMQGTEIFAEVPLAACADEAQARTKATGG
jgi:PAS domain S-box-containing protein